MDLQKGSSGQNKCHKKEKDTSQLANFPSMMPFHQPLSLTLSISSTSNLCVNEYVNSKIQSQFLVEKQKNIQQPYFFHFPTLPVSIRFTVSTLNQFSCQSIIFQLHLPSLLWPRCPLIPALIMRLFVFCFSSCHCLLFCHNGDDLIGVQAVSY